MQMAFRSARWRCEFLGTAWSNKSDANPPEGDNSWNLLFSSSIEDFFKFYYWVLEIYSPNGKWEGLNWSLEILKNILERVTTFILLNSYVLLTFLLVIRGYTTVLCNKQAVRPCRTGLLYATEQLGTLQRLHSKFKYRAVTPISPNPGV